MTRPRRLVSFRGRWGAMALTGGVVAVVLMTAAAHAAVSNLDATFLPQHAHPAAAKHPFMLINWWAWDGHRPPMGWFLLDFAIFVALFAWASNAPLKRVFGGRHERIKRTIAAAAQAHAKASHAHHDVRRRLAAMEAEIRTMEDATVQDGEAERAQMVGAAERYAARLRAESQRQAEQQVRRSEERLRRRLLAQVLRRAEQKVADEITAADHVRLLDEAIDRLASQGPKGGARAALRARAVQGAKP